jgi:guanidinobutyrase
MTVHLFNQPPGGPTTPRDGGGELATMMRLPLAQLSDRLDAAFIGLPLDAGGAHRAGARFGPRQIRAESASIRPHNRATHAAPFDALQVADLGDVPVGGCSPEQAMSVIGDFYDRVLATGCIPLTLGGDHTIALPVLRSVARQHGPLAMIHVDAHPGCADAAPGDMPGHGTPFRRAVAEGLLQGDKVFQIGLRGTHDSAEDTGWPRDQGFVQYPAHELWYQSLAPLMAQIRQRIGDTPCYLSLDIDGIDPAFASGTGTPEIGGLSVPQALEIVRGCRGLQLVGADLVEVAPPYDTGGNTALLAAHLLFEMLCVLPGVPLR